MDEFIEYYDEVPKKKRNFYEIILGEVKQKPHFDIDGITTDTVEDLDLTVKEIVKSTENAFKSLGIEPHQLRWYGSNRKDKRSLHLVIPGFYVKNHYEARKIYYFLREHIPSNLFRFFDSAVYSSNQNFRILGCCKNNDTRYKKLLFREPDEKTFRESLVTRVKKSMKEFPYIDMPEEDRKEYEMVTFDDETTGEAVQKTLDYLGRDNFRLDKIKNSFVTFERLKSTHCSICQVYHDSIYPFIRISPYGKVYLYCYRSREHCSPKQSHRIEIHNFDWTEWIGGDIFTDEPKVELEKIKFKCREEDLKLSRMVDSKKEDLNNLFKNSKRRKKK